MCVGRALRDVGPSEEFHGIVGRNFLAPSILGLVHNYGGISVGESDGGCERMQRPTII